MCAARARSLPAPVYGGEAARAEDAADPDVRECRVP
jgi:hypothetical protein